MMGDYRTKSKSESHEWLNQYPGNLLLLSPDYSSVLKFSVLTMKYFDVKGKEK
jgi:hypothetical protein